MSFFFFYRYFIFFQRNFLQNVPISIAYFKTLKLFFNNMPINKFYNIRHKYFVFFCKIGKRNPNFTLWSLWCICDCDAENNKIGMPGIILLLTKDYEYIECVQKTWKFRKHVSQISFFAYICVWDRYNNQYIKWFK